MASKILDDYARQYAEKSAELKEIQEELKGIKDGIMDELEDGESHAFFDDNGKQWVFEKQSKPSLKIKTPSVKKTGGDGEEF